MRGGILVALDGTRRSEQIFEHIEELVKPWPSRVLLLNVPERAGAAARERAE